MPFYKTGFFNTLRSSASSMVDRPSFGSSSPAGDLLRDGWSVVVNGESFRTLSYPLESDSSHKITYHSQLSTSTKNEAVQSFFSEVLLKQLPDAYKENALWFLTKTFHQGGILFPAAGPTASAIGEATQKAAIEKGEVPEMHGSRKERPREDAIFITTTSRGFKVQNFHREHIFKESELIVDINEAKGTLVASEVILDIDFTKFSSQKFTEIRAKIDECIQQIETNKSVSDEQRRKLLSLREALGRELSSKIIRVEKNKIQTDNPQLSEALLAKSFLNTIIEFIKSLFGIQMNKISSICKNGDDVFDEAHSQHEERIRQSMLDSRSLKDSPISSDLGSVASIPTVSEASTAQLHSQVTEEEDTDLSVSFGMG